MPSMLEKLQQNAFDLKVKANGYYYTLGVKVVGSKLQLYFPYNKDLLEEVKANFEGRIFVPADKGGPRWDIPITYRNIFRLEVLQGKYSDAKPYEQFERVEKYDLSEVIAPRFEAKGAKKYKHSIEMVNHGIIARWFVWAAEMGLGKTLAAMISMEMLIEKYGWQGIIWAGPRSALISARSEFPHWKSRLEPDFYTYEGLRELIEHWPIGKQPPRMVIFDEASKLKNPNAKRTQAAKILTEKMRELYGFDCLIGLLSGTPSPKSPADWWSLCEIGCPGFIREGHVKAFQQRLAIIEQRETIPGAGKYDHIVSWRDSDDKCNKCGMPENHANHKSNGMDRFMANLGTGAITQEVHQYVKCTNEVAKLKTRLRGLVGVWLKEDCLDLPAKRYEVVHVKPSRATLNAAKIIAQSAGRAIEALTLLRELSDGFQYVEVKTGNVVDCRTCKGSGKIKEFFNPANPALSFSEEEIREGVRFIYETDDNGDERIVGKEKIEIQELIVDCCKCYGSGKVDEMKRDISEVDCPKDQVLIDTLEMHEECERLNIYGGFTGTIDRIGKICNRQGWGVIKADGRGWSGFNPNGTPILHPNGDKFTSDQLYALYRNRWSEPYTAGPLAFDGQPGAAGMGLTLTVSPTTFFFSNDFNGENRIQAVDRGHRIGMDVVRGGLIKDVIHLPTDQQVLDNLNKKKDLQYMAMKGISMALESAI